MKYFVGVYEWVNGDLCGMILCYNVGYYVK